ncbi:probable serine/threonine-protein kinase DDB_G0271682 [Ruditapes philippinarum]|uniref:probable serine/threonine-protein kinase DDB_G0271682 n=1 Tax=Ruditapes philippinarum TaxID=129788 RepID=UPI00295B7353|nr:probable serine/threonine-protein kinase DDB_G0271682 [Ruditapes philippinarum]
MRPLVVQNNKGNVKQMGPIEIQSPEKNVKQMGPLVVQNNKGNVKQFGPIEIQSPEQNVKQIGPLMMQNNEGNVKQMGPLEIQNHEQNVKQLGFEEEQDQEPSVKRNGPLEVHDIEKNVYSDSCVTELLGKKNENQGVQQDIGKYEPPSKKNKTKSSDELHVDHLNIPFENFELLEKIGGGGFGEVHRGNNLGTNIAVKKLKLKRMKLVKQSVLREVEINSHIRHPNIVLLMGYSINADHLYILTELIQGPYLDDLLFGEEGHTLQMSQKHLISQQVTQGIAYLHNRNPVIVHRDIKPENILLSPNFDTAKVCDLGLSKLKTMNTMHSTIFSKEYDATRYSGVPGPGNSRRSVVC